MMMLINKGNRLGAFRHLITFGRKVPRDFDFLSSPPQNFRRTVWMAQNGSADASIEPSSSILPTVIGINYGNSYASIAVVSKARVYFFAVPNQVTAHSIHRKDWQTASPMRTVNARLPLLSPFMVKKRYAFYCSSELYDLTRDADTVHRHRSETSTREKRREHNNWFQEPPRKKVKQCFSD